MPHDNPILNPICTPFVPRADSTDYKSLDYYSTISSYPSLTQSLQRFMSRYYTPQPPSEAALRLHMAAPFGTLKTVEPLALRQKGFEACMLMSVTKEKTIAGAMSGGVDSSVAAGLLLEQGFKLLGITAHIPLEEYSDSYAEERLQRASEIAHKLVFLITWLTFQQR